MRGPKLDRIVRSRYGFSYAIVAVTCLIAGSLLQPFVHLQSLAQGQANCQTFKETGKLVCGRFLRYWQDHGGLMQYGYPISNEFLEKSDLDGNSYIVQYFERSVFELHPENQPPYDVLLSQLGRLQFKAKYPSGEPNEVSSPTRNLTPTPTSALSQPFNVEEDARTYPSAPPPQNLSPIFGRNTPGTEKRTCVNADNYEWVRSGEFIAGPFFKRRWQPGVQDARERLAKIYWYPLHTDQLSQLTVNVVRRDDSTLVKRSNTSNVSSDQGGSFYYGAVTVPSAGRWRLVVTSGPDWGCFDLALD